MSKFDLLLASDEDVARRCIADYAAIAPLGARVAYGEDGVITAAAPWDLTSNLTDFEARGVGPGHVVQVTRTDIAARPTDILAAGSAAGHTLTTRRIGEAPGFGQPAGPTAGGWSGVNFNVSSFYWLLEDFTRQIKQELGIVGKTNDDLEADGYAETAEMACVYRVLAECYAAKNKEGGATLGGAAKAAGSEYAWKGKDWYMQQYQAQMNHLRSFYRPGLLEEQAAAPAPTIAVGSIRLNVRGRSAGAGELG